MAECFAQAGRSLLRENLEADGLLDLDAAAYLHLSMGRLRRDGCEKGAVWFGTLSRSNPHIAKVCIGFGCDAQWQSRFACPDSSLASHFYRNPRCARPWRGSIPICEEFVHRRDTLQRFLRDSSG